MERSAVRDLVHATLAPKHVEPGLLDDVEFRLEVFDPAGPLGFEAVAGSGMGLDLHSGERVLAAVLLRDTPKGHEHRLCTAITDRRTLVSGYSSTSGGFNTERAAIEHAHLTQVEVTDSFLSQTVVLHGPQGKTNLPYGQALKPLGAFYQGLHTQVPHAERVPPPTPFVERSEQDPAGIHSAARGLWWGDEMAPGMFASLQGSVAEGRLDNEGAYDMACRVVLAHRARFMGPGGTGQAWLTPLASTDLIGVVSGTLGPPVAHQATASGQMFDFRVDPKRQPFVTAGTVAGMAAYAVVGVGFSPTKVLGRAIANQLMKREQVTGIRILCQDTTSASWFQVFSDRGKPLEQADAMLAVSLHDYLAHHAYFVLERRCALGWALPLAQLFG